MSDPDRRASAAPIGFIAAGVVLLLVAALAFADALGRTERGIFEAIAPTLGGGVDWAGVAASLLALRLPLLAILLGHLGYRCLRGGGLPDRPLLGTVLGLAWVGQSFLVQGPLPAGGLLYALAAALWWRGARTPATAEARLPVGLEVCFALLVFAGVALACVVRLDVDPPLHVDEMAYAYAARLRLGEVTTEAERLHPVFGIYDFGHFRSQAIAFALQSLGVALLGPGVLALRLVSVAAALVALAVAYAAARRALGPTLALAGLPLAGFAPLLLTSARYGHMISISILHGAVALALLLRLVEKPGRGVAAALGLVLGASIYFYQVSWFVPVLCGLALLAAGRVALRGERARQLVVLAAGALVGLAPGALWLRADFETLARRTLGDRGVWSDAAMGRGGAALGLVVATGRPVDRAHMGEVLEALLRPGLDAVPMVNERGSTALALTGDAAAVDAALESLGLDGRSVVLSSSGRGPLSNAGGMLAELFAKPHIEFGLRLADVPILNPVVAPLIVLGLLEAFRRRREPALRVLLVWIVAGALLPAMLASVAPRRAVLVLPFVHFVAALPLVAVLRAGFRGRAGPTLAFLGVVFVVAYAIGTDLTFARRGGDLRIWREADPALGVDAIAPASEGSILALVKEMKSLPPNEEARVAPMVPLLDAYLDVLEESGTPGLPERLTVDPRAEAIRKIRRASCEAELPMRWITRTSLRTDRAREILAGDFAFGEEVRGPYWFLRIESVRGDACHRRPRQPRRAR